MRRWVVIVPVLGTLAIVAVPFLSAVQARRDEAAAVRALQRVHDAQERFRAATGAYATDLASLAAGCAGAPPAPGLTPSSGAGPYRLMLRVADRHEPSGHDCHGRPLAPDYYVSASPVPGATTAQRAYAARRDGRIFLFYDQVPPQEAEISGGLATPLDQADAFRIP